ncbi:sulfite exporter TauE/SafE family protein [Brevundimonas sp.]|uniref:sulfite exporter TauE/SafE family protein n=1 Tax=Brevundimonas sp. TaxID=1871086 RepID=UPI002D61E0C9|nr:sulfite exporter TauE/SafE family protein [Brevundimonas sp.]HYC67402.1 sulfite exporter TauE/SafE family protein [Brevundimonas sp.]
MEDFLLFAAVGFAAQIVDGALGMAYGVVCSTVLLSLGVPPATSSASVHASKVFTGAASALSHVGHRNVDFRALVPLAAAGIVGGVVGATILTSIDGARIKPYVIAWLGVMGLVILHRAWRGVRPRTTPFRAPVPLGFVGGLLDAMGGGGWGPTVTTLLVGSGTPPRQAIGTSNSAEFFVAVAVSSAFLFALVTGHWRNAEGLQGHAWAVGGLVVGGVVAAPLAGWITKALPARGLTWIVGALVLGLALYQFAQMAGLV